MFSLEGYRYVVLIFFSYACMASNGTKEYVAFFFLCPAPSEIVLGTSKLLEAHALTIVKRPVLEIIMTFYIYTS